METRTMADSLRARVGHRDYPVGIPVKPPPGWRPRVPPPPPSPRSRRRPPSSPFRAQLGLVLKALLVSLLVMVCMGVGWLLTQRRPGRVKPAGEAGRPGPVQKQERTAPRGPLAEKGG